MKINTIYQGDCLAGMKELPDQVADCIVTSPPYFGLRDYGVEGQIGLEETPEQFVQKLVEVFREAKRILKDDGTLWLNLGDSYTGYKANTGDTDYAGHSGRPEHKTGWQYGTLKPKDLIGIPWRVAFALQADGWFLRSDIIWAKPNPMPESVTDRPTKSHEYIFLLSKSQKYYYDHVAIMQDVKMSSIDRLMQDVENQEGSSRVPGKTNGNMKARASWNGSTYGAHQKRSVPWEGMKANKRSVWNVTTKPFKEAHFATFPEDLIVDCIKAGSRVGGIVLDPFMGAGTTALVSSKLNRNFIGFELNETYISIATKRLREELGMFERIPAEL